MVWFGDRQDTRKGETEDGRWKMEDGRWKMEDGRWKMEDGKSGRLPSSGFTPLASMHS